MATVDPGNYELLHNLQEKLNSETEGLNTAEEKWLELSAELEEVETTLEESED